MPPIIEVDHVTKEFQLGEPPSLKHTALRTLRRLAGRRVEERPPFKALDDVHFSVQPGEVLGIIGQNGAGKSTLLKMLAGISEPTRGSVTVRGRVAPLIEVGAGLVPDLTGRENIFLNATILGMSRAEVKRRFAEMVDFAELEEFIDTPIKRYSSGMRVRLGFAIATSVSAEILIVDEVLAVGDLAFQRKCFDRMEELINKDGRTVLLVSHNIRQVERLCSRVLMLESGAVAGDGKAYDICRLFYEKSQDKIRQILGNSSNSEHVTATGEAMLESVAIHDTAGRLLDKVPYRSDVAIRIRFDLKERLRNLSMGVGIHTTDFLYVTTHGSEDVLVIEDLDAGPHEFECVIRDLRLLPGTYALRIGLSQVGTGRVIYYAENVVPFQVIAGNRRIPDYARDGFFEVDANWSVSGGSAHLPNADSGATARARSFVAGSK